MVLRCSSSTSLPEDEEPSTPFALFAAGGTTGLQPRFAQCIANDVGTCVPQYSQTGIVDRLCCSEI